MFLVLRGIGSTTIFGTLYLYNHNDKIERVQNTACMSVKKGRELEKGQR
jgi:hypothetical protein